jgi:hypothetical protein
MSDERHDCNAYEPLFCMLGEIECGVRNQTENFVDRKDIEIYLDERVNSVLCWSKKTTTDTDRACSY